MKTTVKIVNVNNVNQKNHLSRYEKQGKNWNSKDEKVLLECLHNAVKEGRNQVSAFEECAFLTGRTIKSVSVRYYQYLKPRLKEPFYFPRGIRTCKKVRKTLVTPVKKQVTVVQPIVLDLHYFTTKELFNKLSLEKKLQLISECISTSL